MERHGVRGFISGTPQTIGAGNMGGMFTVDTASDGVDEPDGSVTASVTGDGSTYTIGSPSSATVTVNDDDETLTTSAGANGTIYPSPGDHVYTRGTPVTVTATPDDGYRVASWGGDCGGKGLTCQLTMDANKTASVSFEALPRYSLSASIEELNDCGGWDCGGSVSPTSGTYTHGTTVTVTATLDDLTFLDHWKKTVGGVTTTHSGDTLSFDITGDTTVTGYIRSVCEVMIEICTLRDEDSDGDGQQPVPP